MKLKFWGKKQEAAVSAGGIEVKLPSPKGIHDLVGRFLVVKLQADPDWVWNLKQVERPRPEAKTTFDVRIYNESEVRAKNVIVKNYASLDTYPDLIRYEGWFDKKSMQVNIEAKKASA